jgi:hypothetical protein
VAEERAGRFDDHDDKGLRQEEHRAEENAALRATMNFIDRRITEMEIRNKEDHELLLHKIELHNSFAPTLAEVKTYCEELKGAKIRDRVKGLEVYLTIGIAIITGCFIVFGFIVNHLSEMIIKKLAGG